MLLTIPKLSTYSLYSLKWNLAFLRLDSSGDGGANLGVFVDL
jgi:hypothetical protein